MPLGSSIPATAHTVLPSSPITSSATLTINPFGLACGALALNILAACLSLPGCLTAMATNTAAVLLDDPDQR